MASKVQSLRAHFPLLGSPPPPPSTARKGPAFWGQVGSRRSSVEQLPGPTKKQAWIPDPPPCLGLSSWSQLLVFLLVVAALILFSLLMGFIGFYIWKSDELFTAISQRKHWEKRLNDAIKQEARGRTVQCQFCLDNHWLQRGDSCYNRTRERMPWPLCLRACRNIGAVFLQGTTEAEMEFLFQESRRWYSEQDKEHIPEKTWIGLFLNLSEKTWHWIDGEYLHVRIPVQIKFPYSPLDFCVAVSSGKAFTNKCSEKNYCLCKRPI